MDFNILSSKEVIANTLSASQNIENLKKSQTSQEEVVEKTTDSIQKEADGYVKKSSSSSAKDTTGIYSKENITKAVKTIEEQRTAAYTKMLTDMLGKQANAKGLSLLSSLTSGSTSISISASDIEEAKKSISEGGEWSVDAVATRIMDMAELLADGDSSKLATLKEAVIKGFGGAVEQMGYKSMNQMPSITSQTYDEVMKRFDEWENSFAPQTVVDE